MTGGCRPAFLMHPDRQVPSHTCSRPVHHSTHPRSTEDNFPAESIAHIETIKNNILVQRPTRSQRTVTIDGICNLFIGVTRVVRFATADVSLQTLPNLPRISQVMLWTCAELASLGSCSNTSEESR